jgi:hypothetical protein
MDEETLILKAYEFISSEREPTYFLIATCTLITILDHFDWG